MENKLVDLPQVIEEFEAITSNAKAVQEEVLRKILEENSGTEYLQRFGLGGKTDPQTYASRVPLVTHPDMDPYIQRIADGETNVLTKKPVTHMSLSSGTTQGKTKFIPYNDELTANSKDIYRISFAYRNREFPIGKGKVLNFIFTSKQTETNCGLKAAPASTNVFRSSEYWETMEALQIPSSSPKEVILTPDYEQVLYCHLLCGLIYREEIQIISAIFGHNIVHSFRKFEQVWEELCSDIRTGVLSSRITAPSIRTAMEKILKPDPELADVIHAKCSGSNDWNGIIPELFPNVKYVFGINTGSLMPYTASLRHYAGSLRVVCMEYGASEGWIGVNVDPATPPEKTLFTVVPHVGYFEFIPVTEIEQDVIFEANPVGLTEVKVGEEYELVITNFAGLYRYKLGDVVKVMGFYNSTPQLQYIRRKSLVLSISIDKNTEQDLQLSVDAAAKLLTEEKLEVVDYTSQIDRSKDPACYVIYWEVSGGGEGEASEALLQQCCNRLDTSFVDMGYVVSRKIKTIGPLELRVLREGTFQKIIHNFLGMGFVNQIKIPRCVTEKNKMVLQTLSDNVVRSFFSTAFD